MTDPRALSAILKWRADPVLMVRELFGVEPYPWQAEALRLYASGSPKLRIALQSPAARGKTAVLAWIGWHFMLTATDTAGEHPKGAVTSCSADNLRDNLWAELAKWRDRAPLLQAAFEWTKERIFSRAYPATWFLSARTYSKTANSDEQGRTLSGLHAPNVLMLCDESGDTGVAVLRSAEQTFSGPETRRARIVQSGNPISHDSMLYAASHALAHEWHVIRISGDPDDPACTRTGADLEWAREQIATHGRDNPWVMAYVLGVFPPTSINSLLGVDEVAEAMGRNPAPETYSTSQRRIGVDVARFGDDATILFPRQGLMAYPCSEMRGARTDEIAARVALAKERFNSEVEFIDDTGGFGGGVIDSLIRAGHNPVPVNYAGKATDPKYFNKRSEMWFQMAAWIKRGGALPKDTQLARELVMPVYWFEGGKFRLQGKSMGKDRSKGALAFSPNRADALAQTFCYPEMPTAVNELGQHVQRGQFVSEYDHLARK